MPKPYPAPTTAAVDVAGVTVALGGTQILHGVDFGCAPGEVVAIMGGNGSGKSTLVRTVVGAIAHSTGDIRIFGEKPSRKTMGRVGYVPQRISAASGVSATAREVVSSGLLGGGHLRAPRDARTRAEQTLADMGIGNLASKDVSRLSGGQQQRVLIARALVRNPELLILDEPMAGVDVPSQEALAHALDDRKKAGTAIVIVLHELGALAPLIDTAVVLEHGCVTHVGEPPRDLGVHALPGHDHVHPHDDPHEGEPRLNWEVTS
ncbi:metal ABC transporter ATP-binding protein [Demequina aurantiaca]|uniref:metal ABC transporter ATP-binding protein n=1 Tax=Demequina aurantiaca TaxID=676200 RepID=UPI00078609DE|nr:ATP-binding cassette domain-containing protein [Demequina aurantiaca]